LAARLNGRLVGAPVIIALPGCLLLRDRGWRQSQQSQQCRTHSKGRFHHTSLRENSAHACGLAATAPARRKLPRWQPQCGPQPLTGSATIVRSLFLPCQEQRANGVIGKRRRHGAPPSDRLQAGLLPRRQWAVSVEESASTAGSVVTEVSVGLAFSSSHSIGSGLRGGAAAGPPRLPRAGTRAGAFFVPCLVLRRYLAVS